MYKKDCYVGSAEKIFFWIRNSAYKNRFPLLASVVVGFLTYTFAFTNKLVNHDDILYLFSKGAGLSSGRWGLEFLHVIFPNFSMPWIYGVISVVLIAISSCIIIRVFDIKNRLLQILLSGVVIAFPSLVGTFSYMFTASSYALSFFLAVFSLYLFTKDKWLYNLFAVVALVVSLGIYQSYISLVSSLMLVLLLKELLYFDKPFLKIFKKGLYYLIGLVSSLAIYYLITKLLLNASATEFNSYASESFNLGKSILENVLGVYSSFFDIILQRRFCLITTPVSQFVHILMFLFTGIIVALQWIKCGVSKKILTIVIVLLFPLSINCMFLVSAESSIHTLVLYGFISVYVLVVMVVDNINIKDTDFAKIKCFSRLPKEAIIWCMAVILISNIYVGNAAFLRMYLNYEKVYSFYNSVTTIVKSTPGFNESSKIALVGSAQKTVYYHTKLEEFGGDIMGTRGVTVNSYTRQEFIQRYIGMDVPFASEKEIEKIKESGEYKEMPIYPYYGSVKKIGDYIVVKFE